MEYMKECPFCGAGNVALVETGGTIDGPGKLNVKCQSCGVYVKGLAHQKHLWSDPTDTKYRDAVLDQWNTRRK